MFLLFWHRPVHNSPLPSTPGSVIPAASMPTSVHGGWDESSQTDTGNVYVFGFGREGGWARV